MPEAHPAYRDLPAVHMAEVQTYEGRWIVSLVGPGPQVLHGPDDLGPTDTFTEAQPDDPGRYLTAAEGRSPVPPLSAAVAALEAYGYTVAQAAVHDPKTAEGWTQTCHIMVDQWTAPCHPLAP